MDRAERVVRMAIVVAALAGVAASAHAGAKYRFRGAASGTSGFVTFYYQEFDRTDAGGSDERRFDEVQPEGLYTTHVRGSSSAGKGFLRAAAYSSYTKTREIGVASREKYTGFASAEVTVDDVVISGPPGPISTSFNLQLSGTSTAVASQSDFDLITASSDLQLAIDDTNNTIGGGGITIYRYPPAPSESFLGMLQNYDGIHPLVTPSFTVLANTPFKIHIYLQAFATVDVTTYPVSSSFADTDYSHTLTLVTDRPVFNLPPGYTANSPQLALVDNLFVRPCPGDLNADSQVDDADFQIFAPAYDILACDDPSMTPGCPADLNTDGFVDDADFQIFVVAYDELICP